MSVQLEHDGPLAVLTFVPEITLWLPNLLLPEPGRSVVR